MTYYTKVFLKKYLAENYASFEDYWIKNSRKYLTDWKVKVSLDEGLPPDKEKKQRREIARRYAKQDYDSWLKNKREALAEQWKDRLLESNLPNLTEIVGLAKIADALGYSPNTLKYDTRTKNRLASLGIIYQGPDGRWRASKVACDAYQEGRKKK